MRICVSTHGKTDDFSDAACLLLFTNSSRTCQELWEKRDLNLVGVLALREILAALEQERSSSAGVKTGPEKMTVGGVCRHDCFTVKVSVVASRVANAF